MLLITEQMSIVMMPPADFDDLGLTGTSGAFNATGFLGDSRDSDVESVTMAAKIIPAFFLLVGVTGNVVTIVALYRCKVGIMGFYFILRKMRILVALVIRHTFICSARLVG